MKVVVLLSVVAVVLATPKCGENSHYDSCGTYCPLTCDNYRNGPEPCFLLCNPGCHCNSGYVKNAEDKCVKPEECPAKSERICSENERYSDCGSPCPLTCDNYDNPPMICPIMCVMGCHCEAGFVRARDGKCVKPEECPSKTSSIKSCRGKPETGMCKAYMPSWYYDVSSEKCYKFIYGGCGGNGNRYATEKECLKHCRK